MASRPNVKEMQEVVIFTAHVWYC